jgi:hypothetical protein
MLKEIDQMNPVSQMKQKNVRRRRPKSLALIGMGVTLAIALIVGAVVVVLPRLASHAATVNPNCTLIVPANPLSAKGLATPYQLFAPDAAANGPCNEANTGQSAFVQATILDPATGALSAYEPLVIDKGTKPAIRPTVPTFPANAVVGLWFGFNGTFLHLGGDVNGGVCVNGTPGSDFGQFAACNAAAFFKTANNAIGAGLLKIPALGMGNDGQVCPSVRSFAIVDMDQSDNVQTQYLATANGQIAQLSAANQAKLNGATTLGNPSDNALVSRVLDPVLGCTPFTVPDLANPGTNTATLAGDELEAAADQKAPVARIPAGDEMVLVNGQPNLNKINAYRTSVDQRPAATLNGASTTTYCKNIMNVQLPSLNKDQTLFQNQPSPDGGATATTLFGFLANRLSATIGDGGLNCLALLNIQNPVTLVTDGNGVVTSATVAPKTTPVTAGNGGTTTGAGGVQQVATGGATITLDPNAGNADVALNITYPNHPNAEINVNLAPDSCSGTAVFSQDENTDGNSQNDADTVVNGLQGLQTLPLNWFFTVTDPNMGGTVVGCGSVTANGVNGTATLGVVNAVPAAPAPVVGAGGVQQVATGGATITLDPNAGNADVALNITYPNHPNGDVNVNLAPGSCTATPAFTQNEDLDGNSQNDADTVVNGLQGLTALPNNWFFTVTDANNNNVIVGCGTVVVNGVNGTATLGIVK